MVLFYYNLSKLDFIGFVDVGYLYDPHNVRSHIGNVLTYGGMIISWCSIKQILVATSSNNVEISAIHEASREFIRLRSHLNISHELVDCLLIKKLGQYCLKITLLA